MRLQSNTTDMFIVEQYFVNNKPHIATSKLYIKIQTEVRYVIIIIIIIIIIKVKFTLEQATKAQRGSRGIALL
jgi:hypothetical protein